MMVPDLKKVDVWFVTGSQNLYGEEALQEVASDARHVAQALSKSDHIPVNIVFKPIVTTSDEVHALCLAANNAPDCIGLVTWMHTFSPAKMWIAGLRALCKPFVHLHTQFNRDIPWASIDMNFMNLNQSAHGGREFGFIGTRMRRNRKVIVGYWQDERVQQELAVWTRAAAGWHDMQTGRIARFGDNMREVAVTEGDKVEAQVAFGYSVNGYGIGDLVERVDEVTDAAIEGQVRLYDEQYAVAESLREDGPHRDDLKEAARIELGMRSFLEDGEFTAFTTTFENLHGLKQLPGLAVQRLMAEGYGFGAEGDWKTAALVRAMKVMAQGLDGGTSFMEDYTYHLKEGDMKVLGAHMLEVCESVADRKPCLEIHPLGIGGKEDPIRLVFNVPAGHALNASMIDLGNRFRMIVNDCDVVAPDEDLPNLPVARAVWKPKPDLPTAAAAWIHAGGAHHTGFTQALTIEHMEDLAGMADIEFVLISDSTSIRDLRKELRWNDVYYHIRKGV